MAGNSRQIRGLVFGQCPFFNLSIGMVAGVANFCKVQRASKPTAEQTP
jgi:hypothetical protein